MNPRKYNPISISIVIGGKSRQFLPEKTDLNSNYSSLMTKPFKRASISAL